MNNILIIKLRYIGDVLLATPVLQRLHEHFPQARLVMLVNEGTEEVLRGNPDVDEVWTVARGGFWTQAALLRRVRAARFDCVIDLTDGDRSAFLTWISGAPVRIGFNTERRFRGRAYTSVVETASPRMHRVERNLVTLRPLGLDPKPVDPILPLAPDEERAAAELLEEVGAGADGVRPLVMLLPGARYWFKAWPAERFAKLADRLTEAFDCRVLVGGSVQERALAESIRDQSRSRPVVLAGQTTIRQYAAVVKGCALFIGNDNGPMHIAAAVGIPVVGLFGPSDPAVWGPRGDGHAVLYKGLDCRDCFHPVCYRGEDNCMRQISVDEVFEAATRQLGRT